MNKYIIVDLVGNQLYGESEWNSFEDAEDFLQKDLGDRYSTVRPECLIILKPTP